VVPYGGAVREGVDPPLNGLGIDVNDQLQAELPHPCIAKFVHFSKLPGRVHMEEWERRFRREERLDRQMQHDRTVFAYGVKHYRLLAFGNRLSHDVDALRLEPLEVGQCPHLFSKYCSK
jgi:hypothetical protein